MRAVGKRLDDATRIEALAHPLRVAGACLPTPATPMADAGQQAAAR